jgi:CubicO group peptidase (beta-lactamase class C family)
MKRSGNFMLKLSLALMIYSLQAVAAPRDKAAEIDRLLNACRQDGLVNGVALVAEKGRVIYRRAFGTANVEWDIPNAVDTRFSLFSISKQFTAVLALMMVEEGRLKLDGTILDYLPYFRMDTGRRITVHHLMCHTHGIPYVSYNRLPYRNKLSKVDFFKEYYSGDLEFEPGSGFKYSDGFDIVAAIVEVVSGKPFESLMQERIFGPLGMKDTGFYHVSRNIRKHASDYAESTDVKGEALYELPLNGSSALYSTVDDLLKWDRALAGNKLLSKPVQDMMFRVQADFGRPYGYGYDIAEMDFAGRKKKIVFHEGSGCAIISRSLEDDNLVILLNNILGENISLSREIMNILNGLPARAVHRSAD